MPRPWFTLPPTSLVCLLAAWAVLAAVLAPESSAETFNIRDYGATRDDETDDTAAILAALDACRAAGGGKVFVPAGTYLLARQAAESPILPLPSNLVFCGEGTASTLKFHPRVNQSNFWRMLGNQDQDCCNITIRDLHLDGSNTHPAYVPGETPEHNHGIFFYNRNGRNENITVRDCLIENFSGDCVGFSKGSRNITIRDVTLCNFVRQGIQLAGRADDGFYLISGCQDLEHRVKPGGSTIHVEHAEGTRNIQILGNRCRRSILAGGADGLILRDNVVDGRIEGNYDRNVIVQGNIVRGGEHTRALVQFGYARNLIVRDNILIAGNAEQGGIYVWGTSRYNPDPSCNVLIRGNVIEGTSHGVSLNGVNAADVSGNFFSQINATKHVLLKRTEAVTTDLPVDAAPDSGK